MMENYFGIFECYSPRRGCIRTLIMSGTFTPDDLNRVAVKVEETVYEYRNNNVEEERELYYGSKLL